MLQATGTTLPANKTHTVAGGPLPAVEKRSACLYALSKLEGACAAPSYSFPRPTETACYSKRDQHLQEGQHETFKFAQGIHCGGLQASDVACGSLPSQPKSNPPFRVNVEARLGYRQLAKATVAIIGSTKPGLLRRPECGAKARIVVSSKAAVRTREDPKWRRSAVDPRPYGWLPSPVFLQFLTSTIEIPFRQASCESSCCVQR